MAKNDVVDIVEELAGRRRREVGDRVLADLGGPTAEQLAALTDGCPEQIKEAVADAVGRGELYRAWDARRAEQDLAEGVPTRRCCNMVCGYYQQAEGWSQQADMSWLPTGDRDVCTEGAEHAQGCMYRMTGHPPNDPFMRVPSHAQCVRLLQRLGVLPADCHGKWEAADYALSQRRLWCAYVEALVRAGDVQRQLVETDDEDALVDRGEENALAHRHLRRSEPARAHLRDAYAIRAVRWAGEQACDGGECGREELCPSCSARRVLEVEAEVVGEGVPRQVGECGQ